MLLFYPKCGLLVAFISDIVSHTISYYYRFPNYGALVAIFFAAIIFVIIAFLITYFIEKIRDGEPHYMLLFEHSQLGFVLFGLTNFTIRQTNVLFPTMLNNTPEEIKGKSFTSLCLTSNRK